MWLVSTPFKALFLPFFIDHHVKKNTRHEGWEINSFRVIITFLVLRPFWQPYQSPLFLLCFFFFQGSCAQNRFSAHYTRQGNQISSFQTGDVWKQFPLSALFHYFAGWQCFWGLHSQSVFISDNLPVSLPQPSCYLKAVKRCSLNIFNQSLLSSYFQYHELTITPAAIPVIMLHSQSIITGDWQTLL